MPQAQLYVFFRRTADHLILCDPLCAYVPYVFKRRKLSAFLLPSLLEAEDYVVNGRNFFDLYARASFRPPEMTS